MSENGDTHYRQCPQPVAKMNFDLFVMFHENDSSNDVFNYLLEYQSIFVPFHFNFLSDFTKVLFWDPKPIELPTPYFIKKYQTASPTDVATIDNGWHMHAVLNAIYMMYVYIRVPSVASPTQALKMEDSPSIDTYKKILALLLNLEEIKKLIEGGFIEVDVVMKHYFDILNYVCTKAGDCKSINEGNVGPIFKFYTLVKVTVITIKSYTWVIEITTVIQKLTVPDYAKLFLEELAKIKFVKITDDCISLDPKKCAEIVKIYTQFTTLISTFIFQKITFYEGEDKKLNQPAGFVVNTIIKVLWTYEDKALGKVLTKMAIHVYLFRYLLEKKDDWLKVPGISVVLQGILVVIKQVLFVKQSSYDHKVFLELLKRVFGRGQVLPDGGIKLKVSVTKEHVVLIEQFLYVVVVQRLRADKNAKKPDVDATLASVFDVLKNMYLRLQMRGGQPAATHLKDIATWEATMANAADKSPKKLYDDIMMFARSELVLRSSGFFRLFNVNQFKGFAGLRDYERQNPLTVVYNFLILTLNEADKRFDVLDMTEYLLFSKIKFCMEATGGEQFDEANRAVCIWSHRKYAELYYFALYAYRVSTKSEVSIVEYFKKDEPLVHVRIFVAVMVNEKEMKAEYARACESSTTELESMCMLVKLYDIAWNHVANTDKEALSTEEFNTRLMTSVNEDNPAELKRFKYALLGVVEVLTYMSTKSIHYDRLLSFMDYSRTRTIQRSSLTNNLKSVVDTQLKFFEKKIFALDANEKGCGSECLGLATYLRRTFGKLDYSASESRMRAGVSGMLTDSFKVFDKFFTYAELENLSQFKSLLSFAYGVEFKKLAEFLIRRNIFLQIPNMNNPNHEKNFEFIVLFIACDSMTNYEASKAVKGQKTDCTSAFSPPANLDAKLYVTKIFTIFTPASISSARATSRAAPTPKKSS